jgi:hypothetical protein
MRIEALRVVRRLRQAACQTNPNTRFCESLKTDSHPLHSFARVRCASERPSGEICAEFFFAAKVALGGTERQPRRVAADDIKRGIAGCARIFKHGRNAEFAGVSEIRENRAAKSVSHRARR